MAKNNLNYLFLAWNSMIDILFEELSTQGIIVKVLSQFGFVLPILSIYNISLKISITGSGRVWGGAPYL